MTTKGDQVYCFYGYEPVFCRLKFRSLFRDRFHRWPTDEEETKYEYYDFKYNITVMANIDYTWETNNEDDKV